MILYLKYLATEFLTLIAGFRRHFLRTKVIVITGSSTKSTTALLIGHILSDGNSVYVSAGHNLHINAVRALLNVKWNTKFLIVEVGASEKGNLKKTCRLLKPDISIVTLVALEHKSYFKKLETLAVEKSQIVLATKPNGLVFLNADDNLVLNMRALITQKVITFAQHNKGADYQVLNSEFNSDSRLKIKVKHQSQIIKLDTQFYGEHYWLSLLSAFAVATELDIPATTIVKQITSFQPLLERGGLIKVTNGSRFLLDTNKAPYHSLHLALAMAKSFTASRKRIVIGHISDSNMSNNKTYQSAYDMAKQFADEVIFVGSHIHRPKKSQEDLTKLTLFDSTLEVFNYLNTTLIDNELIIIKGSSDLHLERIALAHIKDFDCWQTRCGKKYSCLDCGIFYGKPNSLIKNLSLRPKIKNKNV